MQLLHGVSKSMQQTANTPQIKEALLDMSKQQDIKLLSTGEMIP
jgi:hypothetical protein